MVRFLVWAPSHEMDLPCQIKLWSSDLERALNTQQKLILAHPHTAYPWTQGIKKQQQNPLHPFQPWNICISYLLLDPINICKEKLCPEGEKNQAQAWAAWFHGKYRTNHDQSKLPAQPPEELNEVRPREGSHYREFPSGQLPVNQLERIILHSAWGKVTFL